MRSVSLNIPGSFWDSQIYSGELTLFDLDGSVHHVDWKSVVDGLADVNEPVQTAIRVAFADSDLFYSQKVRKVLFDPAISTPIKRQLAELATKEIAPNLDKHRKRADSPFDFLAVDTEIYYGQLFACGDEGLYSAPRHASVNDIYGRKSAMKCHDGPIQQIKASIRQTALAAAAGDDGLFEFAYDKDAEEKAIRPTILSPRICTACDWSFYSVMGWSPNDAFLAGFREERDNRSNKITRTFDRIVEKEEIFGRRASSNSEFIWGCREKVYRFSEGNIEVVNYIPARIVSGRNKKAPLVQTFETISVEGSAKIESDEAPIATATAPFGTVLEFEDSLKVLRSDGAVETFEGEPVHWRVFPRSDHYSNQLHIIYEDRLMIVSFVHDYFVKQNEKLFGFSRVQGKNGTEELSIN